MTRMMDGEVIGRSILNIACLGKNFARVVIDHTVQELTSTVP